MRCQIIVNDCNVTLNRTEDTFIIKCDASNQLALVSLATDHEYWHLTFCRVQGHLGLPFSQTQMNTDLTTAQGNFLIWIQTAVVALSLFGPLLKNGDIF